MVNTVIAIKPEKPVAVDSQSPLLAKVKVMQAAAPARSESNRNLQSAAPMYSHVNDDDNEPPFDYDEAYFSPSIAQITTPVSVAVINAPAVPAHVIAPPPPPAPITESKSIKPSGDLPDWAALVQKLDVKGLVKQLAQQSELLVFEDKRIELRCESRALASNAMAVSGMEKALAAYFKDTPKRLKIHIGAVEATPAKVQAQAKEEQSAGAQAIVAQDSTIQALVREFDGMVLPNSIRAI